MGFGENALVARRWDVRESEMSRHALPLELTRWQADPRNKSVFYEMYAAEYGRAPIGSGFEHGLSAEDKTRLEEAFRRGRLLVIAKRDPRSIIAAPGKVLEEEAAAAKRNKQKEKTWVEVRLVNRKGQPVEGAKYRLKITDGSIREGTTDANGSARVPGIDPGMCEISFLDYDAREWKRA